jgi:hypothetical protein
MANPNEEAEVEFEDSTNDEDFEVAVLKEGEEPPAVEGGGAAAEAAPAAAGISKEDLETLLKSQSQPTEALTRGLEQIAKGIAQPANVPQQGPKELDSEQLEQDLFAAGKSVKTVEEIAKRVLAGTQGQQMQALQAQSKRLLKLDPSTKDTYTKYEKEIEDRVARLPIQYRFDPSAYEQAHRQIVFEHQEEIIADRAKVLADEAIKKVRQELGLGDEASAAAPAGGARTTAKPVAMYQETGHASVSGGTPAKAKTLYLTSADRQDMLESSMDPTDKYQVKAYLEDKQRKAPRR